VLMIDIDYFKHINDSYGHAVGDDVLKQLTRRCFHILRDTDIFGRHGGDEFVAILPESDARDALQVAERLRTEVEELSVESGKGEVRFTVSVGLTQFRDEERFEETLNRADQALYHAKRSGRNRVVSEA
jgi:diguanylate cyclase (GGDEF)-like protein